jgi:RNA polymerase sigma-70 factor (ECF subfamily)
VHNATASKLPASPGSPSAAVLVVCSPAAGPGREADAPLLDGLKRGVPEATTVLLERARPVVRRTVRRLLGTRDHDHEDVAQGALIEIAFGAAQFRGDCPLEAWCSRVTAYVIYKHLRRRQTERRIFGPLGREAREPRLGSEGGAMLRGVLDRVGDHLQTMNSDMAWAFLLHDVVGCELALVARLTGVSVAAAQTRLSRGRRDLHRRIAGDPELVGPLDDVGAYP